MMKITINLVNVFQDGTRKIGAWDEVRGSGMGIRGWGLDKNWGVGRGAWGGKD
jgi:hypothetical protein